MDLKNISQHQIENSISEWQNGDTGELLFTDMSVHDDGRKQWKLVRSGRVRLSNSFCVETYDCLNCTSPQLHWFVFSLISNIKLRSTHVQFMKKNTQFLLTTRVSQTCILNILV